MTADVDGGAVTPTGEPEQPQKPKGKTKLKPMVTLPKGGKFGRKDLIQWEKVVSMTLALWMIGTPISQIQETVGISHVTVNRIINNLPAEDRARFVQSKTNEVSVLIQEHLTSSLKALIKIVKVTDDEDWLKLQRAPELATLFGVVSDKTVRLLAAIERANEWDRLGGQQALPEARETALEIEAIS